MAFMADANRNEISIDGVRYVSANQAAAEFGFVGDYVARLARTGKIRGRQLGKNWYVDRDALVRTVLEQLGPRGSVRLDDVIAGVPLEQGLAELVGYLSLDEPGLDVNFDDDARSRVAWTVDRAGPRQSPEGGVIFDPIDAESDDADDGLERVADIPLVTFSRGEPAG